MNDFVDDIQKGCLVTAGNINDFNTMTIGWAVKGTIWRKEIIVVYVRPSRYTYKFMEENEYFTVSFYNNEYKKQINVLGTLSGRDVDKVSQVGFHPVVCGESVTFLEARQTFLCKKIYTSNLDIHNIPEEVIKKYYPNQTTEEIHHIYYGEIIKEVRN